MSVYRTITRLAVVSALNNYMKEPYPTLAGPYIFDSKIEPVEDMATDTAFPCVVVYTDYDKDQWTKAGRSHADRVMSLTLELLVVQRDSEKADGSYKLECPMTDSEIESTLDVLEAQVFKALTAGGEASDAFNFICTGYINTISRRGASVEGGLRLAARQITLEMKTLREPAIAVIPEVVEHFLLRLDKSPDYHDRVEDIRKSLTANNGISSGDMSAKFFGYTKDTAARLGSPTGRQTVLPPVIVYNLHGGS